MTHPENGKTEFDTTAVLTRAAAHTVRGEIVEAERLLQQALAHEPRHPRVQYELARLAFRKGDKRTAADCLRRGIVSQPDSPEYNSELGFVLLSLGERGEAARAFARALEIKPDDTKLITNIGAIHLEEGRLGEAVSAFRRALEIDPFHLNARINLEVALRQAVPAWHFAMMSDAPRNAAYDTAIRRVVPGRSVLDIGTGAGLLAMMAARAGARSVTSCEAVAWISGKAREVVAQNGFDDRIKLIAKQSTDLRIGTDLSERAEVLVSEVFGSTVLNENVIPTFVHAHRELLRPDATVVPRSASAWAYLAGGPALEGHFFVDRAAGFIITKFHDYSPRQVVLDLNYVPHDALSKDFEIFRFDLVKPPSQPEHTVIDVVATRPGRCFGIVQWIRLDLVDELSYENRPGRNLSINSWAHVLHRFESPVTLASGESVRLLAQHNCLTLFISSLQPVSSNRRS